MSLSSLFIHPAATSTRVFCAIHLEQSLSKVKIIVNHTIQQFYTENVSFNLQNKINLQILYLKLYIKLTLI